MFFLQKFLASDRNFWPKFLIDPKPKNFDLGIFWQIFQRKYFASKKYHMHSSKPFCNDFIWNWFLVKISYFWKKYIFVGKFSYMGAESSGYQKNLEISKLRSKLPSASQNNILSFILPKSDNFEKILTEILRKHFLPLVQQKVSIKMNLPFKIVFFWKVKQVQVCCQKWFWAPYTLTNI